jgi:hypothetical protein
MLRRAALALLLVTVGVVLAGCAVLSGPATGVSDAQATLNGTLAGDANGTGTYWFAYGTTTAYGTDTAHRSITIIDRNPHPVTETVSGLTPGTTYHYTLCAQLAGSSMWCGEDQTFTTSTALTQLSISTQPALFPPFDPAVSDYVTRCGASPVTVSVGAPPGTTVAIDGAPGRSGVFSQDVQLAAGQAFSFSTTAGGQTSTFHVRCLPADFPAWTYSSTGTPRARFYITTPQGGTTPDGQPAGGYVAIFDDHGVPVWWRQAAALDAKLLSDGTLAWFTKTADGTSTPGYEIRRLDGSLVRTWATVGSDTDLHDLQILPNGDALMLTYPPRPGTIDLSPYGGPKTNATVLDAEIQEIAPDGTLVWSWNTKDHIPLSETGARWWSALPTPTALPDGRTAYDYAHVNSIQQVGNTVVASFRHFDAVYAIDKSTGNILYKLGGTPRPESLTVLDDPEGAYPFGGQHFARVLPDGTLTVHDNNTLLSTPVPRAVRYRIDLTARTATLLEQISDPHVSTSLCCGSAERLDDGTWVMSWGGTPNITEFAPGGGRDFELSFAFPGFSYRVALITGATPSIGDLRAGMDAMAAQSGQARPGAAQPLRVGPGPSFVAPDENTPLGTLRATN